MGFWKPAALGRQLLALRNPLAQLLPQEEGKSVVKFASGMTRGCAPVGCVEWLPAPRGLAT
jgi:hypothetical protein